MSTSPDEQPKEMYYFDSPEPGSLGYATEQYDQCREGLFKSASQYAGRPTKKNSTRFMVNVYLTSTGASDMVTALESEIDGADVDASVAGFRTSESRKRTDHFNAVLGRPAMKPIETMGTLRPGDPNNIATTGKPPTSTPHNVKGTVRNDIYDDAMIFIEELVTDESVRKRAVRIRMGEYALGVAKVAGVIGVSIAVGRLLHRRNR